MLENPFDRIVGIGAFVNTQLVFRRVQRPDHDKGPLGPMPPANVLLDDDVTCLGQLGKGGGNLLGSQITDAVGCSDQNYRKFFICSGRRKYLCIKFHAVAHCNH